MSKLFLALRTAFYASCFAALWTSIAVWVRPLDERYGLALPSWVRSPGLVLSLAGGVLAFSCLVVFVSRGRGTPAPFDAPREFVASGPYKYVRNPMYVGALTLIFGIGLALRSVSVAAVAGIFWLASHLFVVLYEERTLEVRFGESYRDYKRRVRRWLPRISVAETRGGNR